MKHLEGRVARGTVYSVAAGEVQRVDLETLSGILSGLSALTGQPVTPNDLLEVIEEPEPLEMDEESKAWLDSSAADLLERLEEIEKDVPPEELAAWHKSMREAVKPIAYDSKRRTWLEGQAALEYQQMAAQ